MLGAGSWSSSRGRYKFDQTHAAVFHWVWEIPWGSSLTGPAGAILKGWQTNGVLTFRSGFPLNLLSGRNDLNTGADDNVIRPDRIADGRIDNPTRKLFYDPTAFQRVTCNIPERLDLCHFGNSGRNILNTPSQNNVNFSAFKNFQVSERFSVQFRAELFNAFNTPYFGAPRGIGFVSQDSIVPDTSRIGEVRSIRTDMRVIQFGLKLYF